MPGLRLYPCEIFVNSALTKTTLGQASGYTKPAQEGPKGSQRCPEGLKRVPRGSQGGPKRPQECPKGVRRRSQVSPRGSQGVPKVPRRHQEGTIKIRTPKLSKTIVLSHILRKNRPKPLYCHTFHGFLHRAGVVFHMYTHIYALKTAILEHSAGFWNTAPAAAAAAGNDVRARASEPDLPRRG